MQINVSQLLKASIGSTRHYKANELVNVTDDNNENIVQGDVRLTRTDRGILAKGILQISVEATCSRCLSVYSRPLALNIEEEYFPTVDVISGASLHLPDDPGYFTIDENHVLDLSEAMRQYELLNIPMKPLCYEDCAGLCPYCGHNFNHGPCGCLSQDTDPRWTKLTELTSASNNY